MFFYSTLFLLTTVAVDAEFQLVQALFRHGDRAPSGRYPTDPNNEESWPRGYSQLTERGYAQAVELGEFLKERYSGMVEKYHRKKIYVRSSDKDRCIETAMGVTEGLFPGQRVPVHTYSAHWEDLLLKPNSVRCDKADVIERRDKEVLYRKLGEEHKSFLQFLSKNTGMEVTMRNVKDVYNYVFREVANGLPQPDWVFEKIGENRTVYDLIVELKRQDRMESFNSLEKSRLRTGYLLNRVVENIEASVSGKSKQEMVLYSSHDATLTSLMYLLGVSDDQLPPYAATLLFELHKEDGHHLVKLFYRRSPDAPPQPLRFPGCPSDACPLSVFQSFASSRTISSPKQHEAECHNSVQPDKKEEKENPVVNTISSVLLLLLGDSAHTLLFPQKS